MADPKSEGIHNALKLDGDARRIKDYYRDWAESYDEDVTGEGYRAPQVVASLAALVQSAYIERKRESVAVMDAGCGTGLSGEALRKTGFMRIDGFDIAAEMVAVAEGTGVYGELLSGIDLNSAAAELDGLEGCYDIVASVGVFTQGHVASGGFDHLVRLARPGMFVIVSTREGYIGQSGFADHVAALERDGKIVKVLHMTDALYVGADPADYWVYRRIAA